MRALAYYIVYALWYLFSLLPLRVHFVFSDMIFLVLYYVFPYRLKIVRKNLAESFPEKSRKDLRKIERGFYHWFCDYIVETMKLLTMSKEELSRRMVFKNTELVTNALKRGQSIVLYLGHYCNWEWITSLPLWITSEVKCGQIYHPLENEYFDKLFLKIRQKYGAECIEMKETLRKILRYRRDNQLIIIGYIADQAPQWGSIHHWLWFLNHETPVFSGPERIATQLDQTVLYLDVCRKKRGYYEATFRMITDEPKNKNEFEITNDYFKMLENSIRRAPELWLWTHNRWKRTHKEFDERFVYVNGNVIPRQHTYE